MRSGLTCIVVCAFVCGLAAASGLALSADAPGDDTVVGTSEFRYRAGRQDRPETAQALAFFGAKYQAVAFSAKYLSHKMLLEPYHNRQREIFCLAADEIQADIVDRRQDGPDQVLYLKIRYVVRVSDFIRAEIKNTELENKESNFPWDQEMEQRVSEAVRPGEELSRAYRYLRKRQRRIAIIYLDHLLKKYPNWGDAYLARAIGYYTMNDRRNMVADLQTACGLFNQEACDDLTALDDHQNPGDRLQTRP
jgi:hypothetical protein